MKNKNTRTPAHWQMDTAELTSNRPVQFWATGTMVTAQMPADEARLLVKTKQAFVISREAIGLLTEGRMDS